jgi:uncharacterized protein YegL
MMLCTRIGAITAMAIVLSAVAGAQDVYSDNVVILLDASGSMNQRMPGTSIRKMDAAKAALRAVLQQVPESTRIGVLVFSASNVAEDWIYPLGPRDDASLLQAIGMPEPGGGTPLGRYMKQAADRLLEERAKQFGYGTYRLLVVTDGQASDEKRMKTFTPEIMARGITVDVIGVNMAEQHVLATQVHSYRSADDAEGLQRAIEEVFAEVATDSTDTADADAFADISGIPMEVAAGMLNALATSGNQPIGERAQRASVRDTSTSPPPLQTSPSEPSDVPPANQDGGGMAWWQIAVIAFIVLMVISRGSRRSNRRGGRRGRR